MVQYSPIGILPLHNRDGDRHPVGCRSAIIKPVEASEISRYLQDIQPKRKTEPKGKQRLISKGREIQQQKKGEEENKGQYSPLAKPSGLKVSTRHPADRKPYLKGSSPRKFKK